MTQEDDGTFAEIADDIESPAAVLFTQDTDDFAPDYELIGDIDLDEAIAVTVKGLVVMVLDALGIWDVFLGEDDSPDE